jgi:hypothetical protein
MALGGPDPDVRFEGVEQTRPSRLATSANDPKRTLALAREQPVML